MRYSEIVSVLRQSSRWGTNSQPSLDWMVNTLVPLPLTELELEGEDTLILHLWRPLNQKECWKLCQASFDEPQDVSEGQLDITLWWD